MATLALSAAGAAVGGQLLPTIPLLGTSIGGAAIGRAIGATAGKFIDDAIFGTSGQARVVEGPRLTDLQVTSSTEGAPIPKIYGTVRVGGQLIWATPLVEEATTQTTSGGKSNSSSNSSTTTTTYSYFANFAVALCEGKISRIGRVWADGKPLDLSLLTTRLHRGSESQQPDSLISASVGANKAPAYRGTAYIVFEHMSLKDFGNRIPQLSFEVVRPVGDFNKKVKAVNIIPAAGEFAYDTQEVTREGAAGSTIAENIHSYSPGTDWDASVDELQDIFPETKNASIIVAWFGTDLRAQSCQLRPGVESTTKVTQPHTWSVGGLARADAHVVSLVDGRPAYGGTPSDDSVLRAIADLKTRGLKVTFNPFILMDIPIANGLADPYGGAEQAQHPWRGRITVHPAPGEAGTPDKTSAAQTQLDAFIGTAQPSDFSTAGGVVSYSGPPEWSYRRFILHYAHLCQIAGGVDTFLLGSELRGLTRVRAAGNQFGFVNAMITLAVQVRAILGPGVKLTYGADWSEFFGYHPTDGTGDVYFNLDPLWSSSNIDAVAIDTYWPLSDWRDGRNHLDAASGFVSIYDDDYLRSNIMGGEYYDWYYASAADRDAQVRTPITDGLGKPWVFRTKDIWSWWSEQHFDRPGGVESASATAWVPESKPVWLSELGSPAVQHGANQPNVFFDPKSSESFLPYFSNGVRDDFIQQRYIETIHDFFDPAHEDFDEAFNPVSTVSGQRMVDTERFYVYAWDARPYPAFPLAVDVWSDGPNWERGHWLNGRANGSSLAAVVRSILDDFGYLAGDTSQLVGMVQGYAIDRAMSAREALQPLELAFQCDSIEGADDLAFRSRIYSPDVGLWVTDELADTGADQPLFSVTRKQETELPSATHVGFSDPAREYRRSAAQSKRLEGQSLRLANADLAIVMGRAEAKFLSETWLHDAWAMRETITMALPPSDLVVEPGDLVRLSHEGLPRMWRVTGLHLGQWLEVEAQSLDQDLLFSSPSDSSSESEAEFSLPAVYGPSNVAFLDLPITPDEPDTAVARLTAHADPWPGTVSVLNSPQADGYATFASLTRRATMGLTLTPLSRGVLNRFDRANALDVEIYFGALSSAEDVLVFSGTNTAAVETATDQWEVIQFLDAELVAERTYRLSNLLRGISGSDGEAQDLVAPGARFVLLNDALDVQQLGIDALNQALNWRYGPATRDTAHTSWQTRVFSFAGRSLRPRAPGHGRAVRTGASTALTWIRQTRVGGDNWELGEVPLGERAERYLLEILDALGAVVRTTETSAPSYDYSDADQLQDFASVQTSMRVRIAQVSEVYGPGQPYEAELSVTN